MAAFPSVAVDERALEVDTLLVAHWHLDAPVHRRVGHTLVVAGMELLAAWSALHHHHHHQMMMMMMMVVVGDAHRHHWM
jgi:hypothetical protein